MNLSHIRDDFPILSRQVNGKPLIYLDNAATTQKPRAVIRAESAYYEQTNSNIHRGIHTLSEEATTQYEAVRGKVARFIGAANPEGVVFTRNTTEAINLVAQGWARRNLHAGDEILLTAIEHHSNLIPWQMAARATGAALQFIPITSDGQLDLSKLDSLLTKRTKLVALTAMSNVLGTITPVQTIIQRAHAVGALALVDGAQAVPHFPVNVQDWKCDFLVFSAHKMLGPTGVGVLYGRSDLLDAMDPFLGGGDMILEVRRDRATWNEIPWKFEAGTPHIGGVIAFGAALDYLTALGMDSVRQHERELTAYALDLLSKDPHVTLYGPRDAALQGGVISFNYGQIHPHDIGTLLDQEGIAIRAGHHCCQPLMRDLGISGTARASFYIYNTLQEIDALVKALKKAASVFEGSPLTSAPAAIPDAGSGMPTAEEIRTALRPIQDPEINLGILDLGLIYGVQSEQNGTVRVRMTLTSPACPVGPLLQAQVHAAVLKLPGVKEAKVDLVWEPPWDPRTMATDDIKMELGLL